MQQVTVPLEGIDTPLTLAGVLGSLFITGLFGYLGVRAKKGSDSKDVEQDKVVRVAEEAANLRPVVDLLVTQMARVQEELLESRVIVRVKYPIALAHITALRHVHQATLRVPNEIEEDLELDK